MSTDSTEKEITQLREQINEYNYRYYIKDDPSVRDEEYDVAFRLSASNCWSDFV